MTYPPPDGSQGGFPPPSPYTYGAPVPADAPPARGTFRPGQATGKQILSASWGLLRQDRSLLWLPIMSAIFAGLAAAIVFTPSIGLGIAADNDQAGAVVGGILAAFVTTVISIYFQAALVLAAFERISGGDPTVGSALRSAWQHRGPILAYALLATTVGLLIRAVEQRLGAAGRLLGALGGFAWAVATFLAVPAVVAEGVGPIDAIKHSAQLIRNTWGTSLRTTLRFGFMIFLAYFALIVVFVVGIAACASGSSVGIALGVVLIVASVAAFIVLATICGAISTYSRAMIYRYAVGLPVPGIDPALLSGAFVAKGSRGR